MASAEPIAFTLPPVTGGGPPLRLSWDRRVLEGVSQEKRGEAPPSPWRVEDEIDWKQAEAVRMISAVFDDGRALGLAALRPRGAGGHDEESVASQLVDGEEAIPVAEALLSTEYDAQGLPRRLGLELLVDPESAPLRVAADREGNVEVGGEEGRRQVARMAFRLDGTSGTGLYEVVRAP